MLRRSMGFHWVHKVDKVDESFSVKKHTTAKANEFFTRIWSRFFTNVFSSYDLKTNFAEIMPMFGKAWRSLSPFGDADTPGTCAAAPLAAGVLRVENYLKLSKLPEIVRNCHSIRVAMAVDHSRAVKRGAPIRKHRHRRNVTCHHFFDYRDFQLDNFHL